jgi:broad specificity phosphatase PhoE
VSLRQWFLSHNAYLMQHAQAAWNDRGHLLGASDCPLSALNWYPAGIG